MNQPAACGICRRTAARYTCPRCKISYCCAACYASHGQCSEVFFRWQVERELRTRDLLGENSDVVLRGRVQHARDLLSSSKDEVDSAVNRLRLIELAHGAEPTVEEERQALEAARRGELKLQAWVEWWRDADATDDHPSSRRRELLSKIEGLPAWKSIGVRLAPPSPRLIFSALDVVLSYAAVCRAFDGDHVNQADDAAAALVAGSPALNRDARHHTTPEALALGIQDIRRTTLNTFSTCYFAISLVDDASTLISDRRFAAAALFDSLGLLLAANSAPNRQISKLRYLLLWVAHEACDDSFPKAAESCRSYRALLLGDSSSADDPGAALHTLQGAPPIATTPRTVNHSYLE